MDFVVFCLLYASNTTTKNSAEAQKNAQFSFTSSDASGIIALAGAQAVGDTSVTDPADVIEAVKNGTLAAYFEYPADPTRERVKVYVADQGMFENGKYEAVAKQLLEAR